MIKNLGLISHHQASARSGHSRSAVAKLLDLGVIEGGWLTMPGAPNRLLFDAASIDRYVGSREDVIGRSTACRITGLPYYQLDALCAEHGLSITKNVTGRAEYSKTEITALAATLGGQS